MTTADQHVRALAQWAAQVDFAIQEFKRRHVKESK